MKQVVDQKGLVLVNNTLLEELRQRSLGDLEVRVQLRVEKYITDLGAKVFDEELVLDVAMALRFDH